MEPHRATSPHRLQHFQWTAASSGSQAEEVLGDDLEDLDLGWAVDDLLVMGRAQPNPNQAGVTPHGPLATGAGRMPTKPRRTR